MLILQQFEKAAFTKIMPPWTFEELELARPYAFKPVTKDILEARFMDWGGSVRYCLSPAAKFGKKRLTDAFQRVNVDNLFMLLQSVGSTPVQTFHSATEIVLCQSKQVPHANEHVFVPLGLVSRGGNTMLILWSIDCAMPVKQLMSVSS